MISLKLFCAILGNEHGQTGAWFVCICGYTLILHKETLVLFRLVSLAPTRKSMLRIIPEEILNIQWLAMLLAMALQFQDMGI